VITDLFVKDAHFLSSRSQKSWQHAPTPTPCVSTRVRHCRYAAHWRLWTLIFLARRSIGCVKSRERISHEQESLRLVPRSTVGVMKGAQSMRLQRELADGGAKGQSIP